MMMQLNKSVAMRSGVRPAAARRAAVVVRAEYGDRTPGFGQRQVVSAPGQSGRDQDREKQQDGGKGENTPQQQWELRQPETAAQINRDPISSSQQPQQQPEGRPADNYVTPAHVNGHTIQEFHLFNLQNEAINGRAAMLGFVAAVIGERLTNQTVLSQVGGRYFAGGMIEQPWYAADLGFFMIIALTIIASFAPRINGDIATDQKRAGPFTPGLEQVTGRVAMFGFTGLLITEAITKMPVF